MITLWHFCVLGVLLFSIGSLGIVLNRRNLILILLSLEIILLGVNLIFVAVARFTDSVIGEIFSLVILAAAAAEAAIGLAILMLVYRHYKSVSLDNLSSMKG